MADLTLTHQEMKDTLYAIALARVVVRETIQRAHATPTDHPLHGTQAKVISHEAENLKMLIRLFEKYRDAYLEAGGESVSVRREGNQTGGT
jgi:hypothetical protein